MREASEDAPGRFSTRSVLGTALGVLLTVVVLVLVGVWKDVRLEELAEHWRAADRGILFLAIAFSVPFRALIGSHKLWLILRVMKAKISYLDTVRVVMGMGPLQLVLPLKGGEVVAVVFFWRHSRMPLGNASGALVFDRGLNFAAAGIWLLIGLVLSPAAASIRHATPMLALTSVLFLMLLATPLHDGIIGLARRLHPKVGGLVLGALVPWREQTAGRKLMLLGYGMLIVLRPIVVVFLLFKAFHQSPDLADVLICTTLSIFAGQVPGPLMGIGPREGVILGLARADLGGSAVALSVGLLLSLVVYVVPMLVGLPWVPWLMRRLATGRAGTAEQT